MYIILYYIQCICHYLANTYLQLYFMTGNSSQIAYAKQNCSPHLLPNRSCCSGTWCGRKEPWETSSGGPTSPQHGNNPSSFPTEWIPLVTWVHLSYSNHDLSHSFAVLSTRNHEITETKHLLSYLLHLLSNSVSTSDLHLCSRYYVDYNWQEFPRISCILLVTYFALYSGDKLPKWFSFFLFRTQMSWHRVCIEESQLSITGLFLPLAAGLLMAKSWTVTGPISFFSQPGCLRKRDICNIVFHLYFFLGLSVPCH